MMEGRLANIRSIYILEDSGVCMFACANRGRRPREMVEITLYVAQQTFFIVMLL
jgi:hypothetical protein